MNIKPTYTEIFRLKEMLKKANIPFEFSEMFPEMEFLRGYSLCYPTKADCECSVIEHGGSYGNEEDLLEIMGLLTEEEEEYNSVKGYLTAENVFTRIKKHYEEVKQ